MASTEFKSEEKAGILPDNKFLATPAVRNLLKMHKLDASKIKGTGRDGRILKEDVQNYLNKPQEQKVEKVKSPEKKYHTLIEFALIHLIEL